MRIIRLETFLANAGLRNYLFVRLTADNGLTGLGEATLEWQEQAVETLIHEWVEERVLGENPYDVERVVGGLVRDQYQGGATVMTAISGVEIALWDLLGKACGQPLYRLLGGRCHERLPAYANGWYGGAVSPADYAQRAREVVARGYRALKFDPFGTAWKEMDGPQIEQCLALVAAVREAVGPDVELLIEVHGRLSAGCAVRVGRLLAPFRPGWYEEPVAPQSLDLLREVREALPFPVAAGERLYSLAEFQRLTATRACDVVQLDVAHCGGLWLAKKIAALAEAQDLAVSPHCSIGPVALAAAVHFDWSTPNVTIQENFADYDVSWRHELVHGAQPAVAGALPLPEKPGLGLELNEAACRQHPYRKSSFPSLWDQRWLAEFTKAAPQRPALPPQ